jgi:hypothetical protein
VTVLSKLDEIMSSFTALSIKSDILQNKLSTLCLDNGGL